MIFNIHKILKCIRFIFSIALYIPILLVSKIIWLASSTVVTIINSLIIIPIEYIITGDIKFGKKYIIIFLNLFLNIMTKHHMIFLEKFIHRYLD